MKFFRESGAFFFLFALLVRASIFFSSLFFFDKKKRESSEEIKKKKAKAKAVSFVRSLSLSPLAPMPLVGAASSLLPRGAGPCCSPTRRARSATRCVSQQRQQQQRLAKTTTMMMKNVFFTSSSPSSRSPSSSSSFLARPRFSPTPTTTSSVSVSASASASGASSSPSSPQPPPLSSSSSSPLLARLYSSLSRSNDLLPLAVVASALVALARPSTFAFFRAHHYPAALGFLSFSIGLSLEPSKFAGAISRDKGRAFAAGTLLQWAVKPLIGSVVVANGIVPRLKLPPAVGTGVVLCSIVSGAQLSNYATFLAAPQFAPLSVLLTSASTAAGSVATPALALLLLRTRLPPFDFADVAGNLAQVVLLPISAGISAQKMLPPGVLGGARPLLSFLALLDTCCCVGSSLASNSEFLLASSSSSASSSSPLLILAAVMAFHALCALAGAALASLLLLVSPSEEEKEKDESGDVVDVDVDGSDGESDESGSVAASFKRAFAVQGAMQSSLLALLLANTCFGGDPLVSAAAGVSTAAMSVFGFSLVLFWRLRDESSRRKRRRTRS